LIVGKAPFAELAQNFVVTLPKVTKFIDKNSRPFIAKIYRPAKEKTRRAGSVEMWLSF
jgi:hypothetical protein